MRTRIRRVSIAACVIGGIACSATGGVGQKPKKLNAPGYYIAVQSTRDYDGVLRVRGASNLPVGAKVNLGVYEFISLNRAKSLNTLTCVAVDQKGLFRAELQVAEDVYQKKGLVVEATFLTNECAQNPEVLRVVGRHGELLGDDGRPVTMEEVERGMTPGMVENPQLFQVSGWYFGIADIAPLW